MTRSPTFSRTTYSFNSIAMPAAIFAREDAKGVDSSPSAEAGVGARPFSPPIPCSCARQHVSRARFQKMWWTQVRKRTGCTSNPNLQGGGRGRTYGLQALVERTGGHSWVAHHLP